MATMKGQIKWFDVKKGYGFITAEDGTDHFVHFSGIKNGRHYTGLEENDQVTFEVEPTSKGTKAVNVNLTVPAPKSSKKKEDQEAEVEQETAEE